MWEPTPAPRDGRRRVNTVEGAYVAISPTTLLHVVCIVPDFKLGEGGNFLVNDWVHIADDCLQSSGAAKKVMLPPPFSNSKGDRDMSSYGLMQNVAGMLRSDT